MLPGRWPPEGLTEGTFLGRWDSRVARRALERLISHDLSLADATPQLGLEASEVAFLRRPLRRLLRKKRMSAQERRRRARHLARRLETLHRRRLPPEAFAQERLRSRTFLGNRRHLKLLLDGIAARLSRNVWNSWRRSKKAPRPNLRGADLSELDLRAMNLTGADLRNANLSFAVARAATFTRADLRGAKLMHADLSYAHLDHSDLRKADLDHTVLTQASLRGADLRSARLIGTVMNRTDLTGHTRLRGAVVWGVSTWNLERGEGTDDRALIVAPELDPIDADDRYLKRPEMSFQVDGLDVAHFLSMLIENPFMGHVVNASARKLVLLLGRFTNEDQETLDALYQALPRFGYIPLVFQFPEPDDRDTIETVAILAGLSSFVIANLSQPRSTPLEANLIIPTIAVPFVPIIRRNEQPFSMFTALSRKYPWVLPLVRYQTSKGLVRRLGADIIRPAEVVARRVRRMKHPVAGD